MSLSLDYKLQQKIQRILQKFPADSGKCHQCAVQVCQVLLKAGIDAHIVRIETNSPFLATRNGIQLARRIGISLAFHEFVQAGDQIFDALTGALGMRWRDYQNLFYEDAFADGTIGVVRGSTKGEARDD